jgi:hypothetical protein
MPLPRTLFDSLPPHHPQEELERILRQDHEVNHSDRAYDCAFVTRFVMTWKGTGGILFCTENAIFIVRERSPSIAEFHAFNGGNGRDLSAGVNTLLAALSPHYEFAVTFYDNPRINDLLKYSTHSATATRIDDGEDRTFEAKFNLRSS